eukprot:CAMPEP_0178918212 /NCGR_PEP_ID=MMETSP0786-20121207/13700_1 /TAXON_ID=186022 /ORGANISM="Thalassionema frauenfeldii, Strain CCMP 1798" /LENGTH=511 /DNA_ID=CAMNT_0020591895 /DNA_START=121 /DNA_END=1656 /DNA_ORIENTATION=-
MKMKEESPPDLVSSSPSPFRSLSLVFRGFCDPDDVEEDDDDDAYISKGISVEQKSNINGGAIPQNAVIGKSKQTERKVIRSSRRVIIPEAASLKVAQKEIPDNQSREIPKVKSEPKDTPVFKSTEAERRTLQTASESPKRVTATPTNPDPLTSRTNGATKTTDTARGETNGYRGRNHAKGEETGLSVEVSSRGLDKAEGILLAKEKRATKVLLEPTKKKRAARIVETLFFTIFCFAITLYPLQMLGVETDFSMKAFVSDITSSSPISIDIRKAKVIEADQAEDAVKEGCLETPQDRKTVEDENESNIEQEAESMNAEPITSNDEEKSIDELSSEEQDESEPIDDHQESKEEKEDYKEIMDNESVSDDSEESEAVNKDLEPADKRYKDHEADTQQEDETETLDGGNNLNEKQQLQELESMKEHIKEEQDELDAIKDSQESNGEEDPAEIIDNESVSDDSDESGSVNESMDGKQIHESRNMEAESISSLEEQEDESIRLNRDTDNDRDAVDEL